MWYSVVEKKVYDIELFIPINKIEDFWRKNDIEPNKIDDYIAGVTYKILPDGKAEVYYPAISKEFGFEILKVLEKEILQYVEDLYASKADVEHPFRENAAEVAAPIVEIVPAPADAPADAEAPVPAAPETKTAASETATVPAASKDIPVEPAPAPVAEKKETKVEAPVAVAPVVTVPVIDSDMDAEMFSMLGIFIVIVVLYTVAVAIRSINKMPLSKGISFVIAALLTALSIVVSSIVSGYANIYLVYLILLFTFFVFRSKGAKN